MSLLRLLTYNVRRCLGADGHLSPERIGGIIAACRPDIVALQELDVGRARTSHVDQARQIADYLKMRVHFHPALRVFEELYGDAVMTALPSELVKAESLPSFPGLEPRGAVWVQIATDAGRLDLINTHLGLTSSERRAQITRLLGADWVGGVDKDMPLILTGDFNCIPRSRSYRLLTRSLVDGQMQHPVRSRATFPSALPLLRIDYAFISKTIHVAQIAPVRSAETQLASDHLPLQMDFELTKTDR